MDKIREVRERIEFARSRLDPTSGDQVELLSLRALVLDIEEELRRCNVMLDVSEEQRAERERVLFAEAERLTALLKESDDLLVQFKSEHPKLRSQLAATEKAGLEAEKEAGRHRATIERLTAERDEGFRELARQHAKMTHDLAAAREALVRVDGSSTWMEARHIARAALAALPTKVTVVEDDTLPPDAVVMRYGDKSTTITNLALPKEDDR